MLQRITVLLAMVLMSGLPVFAAEAGHGESGAVEAEKPGLLSPDFMTSLWVVIIFVVLLIILYPTAWKNVLASLKAREERIRKDIADAEEARAKAEATLREYKGQLAGAEEKVRQIVSQAAGDGEKIAARIRAHAQQESEEIKERAARDIEEAKTQAIAEIYEKAADLATDVAARILRRNLRAEDQRDLVKESLEHMQNIGER